MDNTALLLSTAKLSAASSQQTDIHGYSRAVFDEISRVLPNLIVTARLVQLCGQSGLELKTLWTSQPTDNNTSSSISPSTKPIASAVSDHDDELLVQSADLRAPGCGHTVLQLNNNGIAHVILYVATEIDINTLTQSAPVAVFILRSCRTLLSEELASLTAIQPIISAGFKSIMRYQETYRTMEDFEEILDNLDCYVALRTVDSQNSEFMNKPLRDYFGLKDRETMTVTDIMSMIHPDDRPHINHSQHVGRYEHIYRIKNKDGDYRWMHSISRLVSKRPNYLYKVITDITFQKQVEEERLRTKLLVESEQKYRALAACVPYSIFLGSRTKGNTWSNQHFLDYTGLTLEECYGFGYRKAIPQEDWVVFADNPQGTGLHQQLSAKGIVEIEFRLISKTGETRWHLAKITAVEIPGQEASIVGAIVDIDAQKQVAMKLDEAAKAKNRFLSTMSHEMRTPLSGICGLTQFLMETDLDLEQQDMVKTIKHSAESLLLLVNDLLNINKIEANLLKLVVEEISLKEILEDVIDLLYPMASKKGIELSFAIDPSIPRLLSGDRFRIRQILLNIVGNAVKFTEFGEVCLFVDVESESNLIRFKVVDTGPGFTELDKEKLFKPFSQIDNSTTRKYEGTGLGLYITKQMIELMGGTIDCKSTPGVGTVFTFTMNLKCDYEYPMEFISLSSNFGTSLQSSMPVYIVTDLQYAAEAIKTQLSTIDATVEAVISPNQISSENMRPENASFVCLVAEDSISDVLDRFLKTIRSGNVIFCVVDSQTRLRLSTSEALHSFKDRYLGISTKFLTRPVKPQKLKSALATDSALMSPMSTLARGRRRESTSSSNEGSSNMSLPRRSQKPTVEISNSTSTKPVSVLIAEDNPVNRKVLCMFLKKLGIVYEVANDGEEALRAYMSKEPNHFDLLISDLFMPNKDGLECIRDIKQFDQKRGVDKNILPTILLTADVINSVDTQCVEIGINKALSKPINFETLKQVLASLLGREFRAFQSPLEATRSTN